MKTARGAWALAVLAGLGAPTSTGAMMPDASWPQVTAQAPDAQAAWRITLSSDRYGGPLTLAQLWDNQLDKLETNGRPRLMYLRDEMRVGVRWGSAWLSMLARQSATLVASGDTAQVVKDLSSRGKPTQSYEADVRLRVQGFAGSGLALETAGAWSWPSALPPSPHALRWRAGVQGLQIRRLLQRDLSGRVRYDAQAGSYAFDAVSSQHNDRLEAPFQTPFAASGWALLFNAGLTWQASPALALDLHATDVGRLWWQDLPAQTMRLSSSTSTLDAQGYLVYEPLLSGNNRQRSHRQRAVGTWRAAAAWQLDPAWQATVAFQRIDGFGRWLPYTGLAWQGPGWTWEAGRAWHEKAMCLRLAASRWQLQFSADRLGSGARARALGLRWQAGWW